MSIHIIDLVGKRTRNDMLDAHEDMTMTYDKAEMTEFDYHGWKLSDLCWNGYHSKVSPKRGELVCRGELAKSCGCPCHGPRRERVKKRRFTQMSILDSGCGTIEVR